MDELLDRFYENLQFNLQREFSRYILKVSQVIGSYYVLIKKPRGKTIGESLKNLFENVKYISERLYKKFSDQSDRFRYKFFLYFKFIRSYGNNQYHFLVVRQDYQYECSK